MTATEATVALRVHVAGPPEKEPTSRVKAGWQWTQRCLRCDCLIDTRSVWFRVGATVFELADDRMTTEPPPGSGGGSAPPCTPEL